MPRIDPDPAQVRAIEGRFARLCLDVFGPDRVLAVVSHGSAVKGGLIPGFSDFDFMAFLSPECFGPFGLKVDDAFALQAGVDGLGVREAGFAYLQAMFYDPEDLPGWWTGPVPGAYHLVHGALPPGIEATSRRLRAASAAALKQAGSLAATDLRNFTDSHDSNLRARLRLMSTRVTPTVFAALAFDRDDALSVWSLDKVTALDLFERRYAGDPAAGLPRTFYRQLFAIGENEASPEVYRRAFRTGIEFLLWAHGLSETVE